MGVDVVSGREFCLGWSSSFSAMPHLIGSCIRGRGQPAKLTMRCERKMRETNSACQESQGGGDANGDLRHTLVVQRIWRIGGAMVIRVSEKTGVGKHQGRITLIPK